MKYYLLLSLVFWAMFSVQATERLNIPYGKAVRVDGQSDAAEWQDAHRFELTLSYGKITVMVKHDKEQLYLGFLGFTPEMGLVPEIFVDTTDYGADIWESGMVFSDKQWWFHVSGSDCWSRGRYNAWDTCKPDHPQWQANNFVDMQKPPRLVEVSLPLAIFQGDSISISKIALVLTDARKRWIVWPHSAQLGIPRTWADVTFQ